MAKMGKLSTKDFEKLQKNLDKIKPDDIEAFVDSCAKELAARLLQKVIKRTVVGQYPASSGKHGGTLRRGWTAKTHEEAANGSGGGTNAAAYADSLEINHDGNMVTVVVENPVKYAPYVEFGHRTADHKGWVPGKFMLTMSEQELQVIAPHVLEAKVKKYLKGLLS